MSKRKMERARASAARRNGRRGRKAAVAATAAGAAIAIGAPSAQAATFNVTNLNDTGAGSLRDAIDQANAAAGADTITFQSGLSGTIGVGAQMEIQQGLAIQGPGPAAITLDGGDADRILYGSAGAEVTISGLTLANGNAGTESGGAAAFYGGAITLDDVVVTGSTASRGAGVFGALNDVTITDSRFSGNSASYSGGGFATDGYSGVSPDDAIAIRGSTFADNDAVTTGGGVSLYDSYVDVLVDSTTISGNEVTGNGGSDYENGGGIWFEDTYNQQTTTLSNSTVSGNSAPDTGGGVSFGENFYAATQVVNSTIVDNSATEGGGIQFADISGPEAFALVDSTVTGNTGGGVMRGYQSGTANLVDAPLDVSSSIVADNAGGDFIVTPTASGDLTLGNVLLGDATGVTYTPSPAGSNIVGADPQLGALADNGGPTKTRLPALTSPAIDAGLANGLTTDQRGLARTVQLPNVPDTHGSDGTDIGAVEFGDTEVLDPEVVVKKPQKVGSSLAVKLKAGAGEDVELSVFGRIKSKRGIPVQRFDGPVASGELAKVKVKPRNSDNEGAAKIKRSLANGKPVKANLTVRMKDAVGNTFEKKLSIKLKPKKK